MQATRPAHYDRLPNRVSTINTLATHPSLIAPTTFATAIASSTNVSFSEDSRRADLKAKMLVSQ